MMTSSLEVNMEDCSFALSHCCCHRLGDTAVSQGFQQSCLLSTFIVLMVCLLVQVVIICSVSFVQLTNMGKMDFLITKGAVTKHGKILYFKYLKLLWHLKDEKR